MPVLKVGMSTHGLGDSSNFAAYGELWRRRGYDIRVAAGGYEWLFKAAGYTTIAHAHVHPWHEPTPPVLHGEMWCGSKVGRNLQYPAPLPRIGHPRALWAEVLNVRLDLSDAVTPATKDAVATLLDGLPRPVVALHCRGHTNPGNKDFKPDLELATIDALIAAGFGVVLLDRDHRGPRVDHANFRRAVRFDIETLYHLIDEADVFVGGDAGPYHLARTTTTPRVGCWWGIHPWHACVPLPTDINLFGPHALNAVRGEHFRVREVAKITAEEIVKAVNTACPITTSSSSTTAPSA